MPRLDCAMDAALLLAALAARAGDRVDLIAFDRRIRARVRRRGRAQVLPAIVAAMAPLEAELIESDWAGDGQRDPRPRPAAVPGGAAHRTQRRPRSRKGCCPACPRSPPGTWWSSPRSPTRAPRRWPPAAATRPHVYDAAAAQRAQAQRSQVSATLGRRGVQVVDAPPDRLPPALADTYLALKAAGRL